MVHCYNGGGVAGVPQSGEYRPGVAGGPASTGAPGPGHRPAGLLVVAAAVGLEALGLVGVVVLYLVLLVRSGAADLLGAVVTAVLAGAAALGLALCARGLLAGRRWSRAPVLTWQLLQLLVAFPLVRTGAGSALWWGALALVVLALVAGGALFVPAVVHATAEAQEPPVT